MVGLQEAVWGRDGETVPASVFFVSAKRGGILIGAFDSGRPVGFVWSLAGTRDGEPTQWSHMLGVLPEARRAGVAERLKLAQRDRAVAANVGLIEWTFDPLQAANAHFNLRVLGAVGASYGVDVYGALAGPLHRGTPTDRLIVEWRLSEPHVERSIRARDGGSAAARLALRAREAVLAPAVLRTVDDGRWVRCAGIEPHGVSGPMSVPVPPRFSEMQSESTELALEWRMAVRDVMVPAFARGYRAVDFTLDRERGGGSYLLAPSEPR